MDLLSPLGVGPSRAALRPLHAAIGNREAASCKIAVLGDSNSEGQACTTYKQVWWYKLQQALRSIYPTEGVIGGEGYFPVHYVSSGLSGAGTIDLSANTGGTSVTVVDTRYGLGGRSRQFKFGAAVAWTHEMTSFRVHYAKDSFGVNTNVYLDGSGSAFGSFNCSGTAEGGFVFDSTSVGAIARGSHSVKVQTTDTAGFISTIAGIDVFNGDESKGIRVYDGSRSGAVAADYTAEVLKSVTSVAPQCVIVPLMSNDAFVNSAATYQTNLTDLCTRIDTAQAAAGLDPGEYTLILMAPPQRSDTIVEAWANYIKAMRAVVAARTNTVFVSQTDWLGDKVSTDVLALFSDAVHMNPKSHGMTGDRVMRALDLAPSGRVAGPHWQYKTLPYSAAGTLTVRTGKFAIYNDDPNPWLITKARAEVGTAPTGAALNLAIKVDGTTAFTMSIAAGATTANVTPTAINVPVGSKVTVDITQIGSTVAGSDLSLTLTAKSVV